MNIELRDKWIKALRSGEYGQATSYLKTKCDEDYSYCCLGVLCEVAGETQTRGHETLDNEPYLRSIRDQLELGEFEENSKQKQLALMNDDKGMTFPQIADWIEANIK